MADKLTLRVRCVNQTFPLTEFSSQSKLTSLMSAVEKQAGVLQRNQMIRIGFPAKEIWSYSSHLTLHDVGIKNREILNISEIPAEERKIREAQRQKNAPGHSGCFIIHSVPANNSCLFTSVSYLVDGGSMSSEELRKLIAGIVLSDPSKYSSSVLDKPPAKYAEWIQKSENWGGAIELAIFSQYFKMELHVLDVQSLRVDKFGSGQSYALKGYLLYNGVHYDALELQLPNGRTQSQFPTEDEQYTLLALEVAKELNQKRKFTDLGSFSVLCQTCSTPLRGQTDAVMHAQTTGHTNFREMDKK